MYVYVYIYIYIERERERDLTAPCAGRYEAFIEGVLKRQLSEAGTSNSNGNY